MEINEILKKIYKCPSPQKARIRIPDEIIVGIGSRRLVTRHPENEDLVVKFGVSHGVDHNKNEFNIYNKAKSENLENLLCPIKDNHPEYRWIIMPYISDIKKPSEDKYSGPQAKKISQKLRDIGIDMYEIETAYYKGVPVAYDYGQVV